MGKRLKLKNRNKARKKHRRGVKKLVASKLHSWSISVRTRDGFTCLSCGSKKYSHAHHLVSKYYRPIYAYDIHNGITLCRNCHLYKGGVHNKKPPKNDLIKQLRLIYKLNDIVSARKTTAKLAHKSKRLLKKPISRKKTRKRKLH